MDQKTSGETQVKRDAAAEENISNGIFFYVFKSVSEHSACIGPFWEGFFLWDAK